MRPPLRARPVVVAIALALLSPSFGSAQPIQSFRDLPLRIDLDDWLRVEDQTGSRSAGRLTRLTRDEIAIQTETGEQRFQRDGVGEVAVRGHALRRSALIGAGVAAVLGAVTNCAREGGGGCVAIGLFGAAPIGAGVGLWAGALIPRTRTVYRAPENGSSEAPTGNAIGGEASLLEDLGLRVNLGDRLRVEGRSGVATTGRLTRLTADEIALRTAAGEQRLARETLGQVAVRRRSLRAAILIGAGVAAAAGAASACTGRDRSECVDAPILASALGAGVGLAVGALIHRTAVVYPGPEGRTLTRR